MRILLSQVREEVNRSITRPRRRPLGTDGPIMRRNQRTGIAQKYAGNKATIEGSSNYFMIYNTLDKHLDVTLANPAKTDWLADQPQKNDRADQKIVRFLRMDEVPETMSHRRNSRSIARLRAVARIPREAVGLQERSPSTA